MLFTMIMRTNFKMSLKVQVGSCFPFLRKSCIYFHSTISKEPTAFETANPGLNTSAPIVKVPNIALISNDERFFGILSQCSS
jgi:hypothetical protein